MRRRRFNKKNIVQVVAASTKRQRFILGVLILSTGLFISEHLLGKSGIYTVFSIAILSDVFLFLVLYRDLKENFSLQVFILPFFFSLSFGLFYFLVPARYITRIIMTSLYALGLYSLFLSENIFTVSSIRTIALLSSARTVSFVITLLSYFFLSNVLFSLHLMNIFILLSVLFLFSFPLILNSIWIYTLDKNLFAHVAWASTLTLCILEVGAILWFWPGTPTLLALFITGLFYVIVGISQIWFEKRLFKKVMWEYVWVAFVVFIALMLFTSWAG